MRVIHWHIVPCNFQNDLQYGYKFNNCLITDSQVFFLNHFVEYLEMSQLYTNWLSTNNNSKIFSKFIYNWCQMVNFYHTFLYPKQK